ncbi:MAG: rubrerythrin family protein [Desulfovibrionaceae bacterium]|nr:rubrerythrin family protein [Desulfovibrionaceae bacterium]
MKSLKGTRTEKNILTAFAGESQARNRYDFFASAAKNEGYVRISQIFTETALQEKEHAKRLFKFLEGGEVLIDGSFPAGRIADTKTNLLASASGENEEYSHMYPEFAAIAEEEGFPEIAAVMRAIAKAEEFHELRFLKLAKEIEENTVFTRPVKVYWRCLNCGCIVEGPEAPDLCPACAHKQSFFEVVDPDLWK